MTSIRLVFASLLAIATVSPGFAQEANTDKKPESTEQPVGKDGLRRITPARDWKFDVKVDQKELEQRIQVAIDRALRSVDGALERLEINIEPIEINLSNLEALGAVDKLGNLEPILITIPPINVDVEPIEVEIPEVPELDIDVDVDVHHHHDIDRDEDDDHDRNRGRDDDDDDDDDDDHHVKIIHKKDKSDSSKAKDDKTKGLKKIN